MTLQFDYMARFCELILFASFFLAVMLPIVAGVNQKRGFAAIYGLLLGAIGGLYLLRTTSAIGAAAPFVASDLPQTLLSSIWSLSLVSIWTLVWTFILPRISTKITSTTTRWVLPWTGLAVTCLYAIIFVIGVLPGWISMQAHKLTSGKASLEQHSGGVLSLVREKNALEACRRYSELRQRLTPTEKAASKLQADTMVKLNTILADWSLKPGDKLPDCAQQLMPRSTAEMQTLVTQLDAVFTPIYGSQRLSGLRWKDEGVAEAAPMVMTNDLELDTFFSSALHPWSHIGRAFTSIDLTSTWLLLCEAAAVFLGAIDTILRRSARVKPSTRKNAEPQSELFVDGL